MDGKVQHLVAESEDIGCLFSFATTSLRNARRCAPIVVSRYDNNILMLNTLVNDCTS